MTRFRLVSASQGWSRPLRFSERVYLDGLNLKTLAASAGGDAFGVIGQLDRFFGRIARETSGVYRLGVESPTALQGATVANEVVVRRRGVSVRSVGRSGTLIAPTPFAPASLEELFRSGRPMTDLPIAGGAVTRRVSTDLIEVIAEVRSSSQRPLRLMFGLVDDQGALVVAGRKGSGRSRSLTAWTNCDAWPKTAEYT